MIEKSFLLVLLLAVGAQAQGIRYTQVCEVENAPTPELAGTIGKSCEGDVFLQGGQGLLRNAAMSILTRSSKTGIPETVTIDHEKKEWRVLPIEKAGEEIRKKKLAGDDLKLKIEVRNLGPDREIAGMMAKGYEVSFGLDLEKMKGSPLADVLGQFRVRQEFWISRDRKLPWEMDAKAQRGVGATLSPAEKMVREFVSMFDVGEEELGRLMEIPPGLTLEMTMQMPGAPGGNARGMLMRIRTIDFVEEKIVPQVFAIPEGYRRVE